MSVEPSSTLLSLEARNAVLQREISRYLRRGYRVLSQTSTTAQLIKPKKFSLFWALVWLMFWGVGILVYILYYMAKRDRQVYVEVDIDGNVITR